MSFDPLARHNILLGCFLITCLKWSLIHFQITAKMNFDPLLIFDAIIGTKVEQRFFKVVYVWFQTYEPSRSTTTSYVRESHTGKSMKSTLLLWESWGLESIVYLYRYRILVYIGLGFYREFEILEGKFNRLNSSSSSLCIVFDIVWFMSISNRIPNRKLWLNVCYADILAMQQRNALWIIEPDITFIRKSPLVMSQLRLIK